MANVLSQEEIDALLGGMMNGEIETPESGVKLGADIPNATFDFADQDRFLRSRLPTLETIHDRFARLLRLNFSTSLRRAVEIQICSQTVCSFGDFTRSLEKPSSLHTLRLAPLKGMGMLVLPARLILTLVDLMFGGNGQPYAVSEDRDFTMIEARVVSKVCDDICRTYTESWSSVHPVQVSQAGSETNVQFINIAQPSDPVNVVDLDVMIDGNRSALSICIPYATIEPIKDILKGSFVDEELDRDPLMSSRLRGSLIEANVEIKGVLGTSTITGRDLLSMKVGDIIQLNEDYEHPVEMLVQGVRKFWGVVGAHKSARALQITGLEDIKRKMA